MTEVEYQKKRMELEERNLEILKNMEENMEHEFKLLMSLCEAFKAHCASDAEHAHPYKFKANN